LLISIFTIANPEIRRQIIHGIELRGRTHPQDILSLTAGKCKVRPTAESESTIVHVLGQISYNAGCLETVIPGIENLA